MKKNFIAVLIAMAAFVGLKGQHIVRVDTLIVPYFQFDYQGWVDSDPHHILELGATPFHLYYGMPQIPFAVQGSTYITLTGEQVQYNYIEGGTNVHGIAVWYAHLGSNPSQWIPMENLLLYESLPDTFILRETVAFDRFAPTIQSDLTFSIQKSLQHLCTESFIRIDNVSPYSNPYSNPCYVFNTQFYYFDKPVHVQDSFYVGASQTFPDQIQRSINDPYGEIPFPIHPYWGVFLMGYHGSIDQTDTTCWPPAMKIKQRWTMDTNTTLPLYPPAVSQITPFQWTNRYAVDFFMIVPLIETYDTLWDYELVTCPQVEWFNVTGTRGDTTTLRWQSADDLHAEWQISYGPKGIDPDNGTLVDCRAASWRHIDSLHTRDSMSAWVRTVCRDEGYLRYSDWSHEVSWGGQDSTVLWTEQPQGNIRLEGLVRLTPNPATDEVTIASAYRLSGVEVYSMDGRLRYQAPAQGLTCRFAVQGWTRGTYLVLVQTAAGTSTKKLVVR